MEYTVFITVLSGVLIFVLGQLLLKFILDPIHKQRETIGDIADSLIYYSNLYTNLMGTYIPEHEERKIASEKVRQLSTVLVSRTHLIPFYAYLAFFKCVPKEKHIKEVASDLIGLSNGMFAREWDHIKHNDKRAEDIKKKLNIRF